MQARHLALIASAALVTAGGLYLFLAVRSTDAELQPALARPPSPPSQARATAVRDRDGDGARASDEDRSSLDVAPDDATDAVFSKDRGGRPHRPGGIPGPTRRERPSARGDDATPAESPRAPFDGANAPDLDGALLEANKAYDRKDFETARRLALALLEKQVPGNVRMLRVVVASSCILGEVEVAQKYVAELPTHDRDQMVRRCAQYGIALP